MDPIPDSNPGRFMSSNAMLIDCPLTDEHWTYTDHLTPPPEDVADFDTTQLDGVGNCHAELIEQLLGAADEVAQCVVAGG